MTHLTLVHSSRTPAVTPLVSAPSSALALDEPPYAPEVPVRLSSRRAFLAAFPSLAAVLEAAPTHPHTGDCLAVHLRHLTGLLYARHHRPTEEVEGAVPVFRLPAVFEPHLAALAGCYPDVVVEETLDLEQVHCLVEWSSRPASGAKLVLWMDALVFTQILNTGGWEYRSPWPGLWQPVIMMAGETVAIGGLWKDDGLMDTLQVCSISTQGYFAQEHYLPEEIQAAQVRAQTHGATPWCNGLWSDKDARGNRRRVLQPPAFNDLDL